MNFYHDTISTINGERILTMLVKITATVEYFYFTYFMSKVNFAVEE